MRFLFFFYKGLYRIVFFYVIGFYLLRPVDAVCRVHFAHEKPYRFTHIKVLVENKIRNKQFYCCTFNASQGNPFWNRVVSEFFDFFSQAADTCFLTEIIGKLFDVNIYNVVRVFKPFYSHFCYLYPFFIRHRSLTGKRNIYGLTKKLRSQNATTARFPVVIYIHSINPLNDFLISMQVSWLMNHHRQQTFPKPDASVAVCSCWLLIYSGGTAQAFNLLPS